jgi:hypothetical protein
MVQLGVTAESQPDISKVKLQFIFSEPVTKIRLEPAEVSGVMKFAAESCGT